MKKIYLVQDSDSDFFDRNLIFTFVKKTNGTPQPGAFENFVASVEIAGIVKTKTLESNGEIHAIYSAKDTAQMPLGVHQIGVTLTNTAGRVTAFRVPIVCEIVKKSGLNGAVTLDDSIKTDVTIEETQTAVNVSFDIGSAGGISAYSELMGKPKINSIEIIGDKTAADFFLANAADVSALEAKTDAHIADDAAHVSTVERTFWNSRGAASDLTALETKIDVHIADDDIHVTSADKMAWDQKATLSDIAAALVPYSTIAYVDAADQAAARDLALHEADALAHVSALERDLWNDAATDAATAKTDAAQAKADATAAKSTADAVDAKATAAATDATQAKADAAAALTAAQGVDAKATQAQTDAANALTAAQTAQTKAESVESIAQSAETKAAAAQTSASTAATDAAAALSAVSGKADAADLTAHTSDTTAHVAAGERVAWNAKADKSDIPDVSVFAKTSDLAAIATSGAYSDLSGTPSIPSKTSDLTNDSGFITDISGKQDALTAAQLNAVNSGITTAKVSTYDGYATSKANAADLANYLPLSGGVMIGDIAFNSSKAIMTSNSGDSLYLLSGDAWDKGARLSLHGRNVVNVNGWFDLFAKDDSNACHLIGTPDGSLTWGGKSVDCIDSQGDGWIRYTNGIQICWGSKIFANIAIATAWGSMFISDEFSITLAKSFVDIPSFNSSVIFSWPANMTLTANAGATNTSSVAYIRLARALAISDITIKVSYIAIGKWK